MEVTFKYTLTLVANSLVDGEIFVKEKEELLKLQEDQKAFFEEKKKHILLQIFHKNIVNVDAQMPNAVKNIFLVYSLKTGGGIYNFLDDNAKLKIYDAKDKWKKPKVIVEV